MGLGIIEKLLTSQLVHGEVKSGEVISINITQILAHDGTAPLVLAQFEQLNVPKINCDLAIFYVDHEILPTTTVEYERLRYIREAASHFGALFSRPGNGISHHVHLERMATPGRTVLGATIHAPVIGALGMLALSADAVEVAAAMAGEPFHLTVPRVLRVVLHGKARPFVSPKDIGLELLRRHGLGGLSGHALEFDGPGARALGVYERATIADLGVALGAVATVFPSDEKSRIFLQRQRRSKSWRRLEADQDACYDETESVDLAALEPLALCGFLGGGEVRPIRELQGEPIQEVLVGSCGNASIRDLLALAGIMRGKKVHSDCTFSISPGSRQALEVLARGDTNDSGGSLADLVSAGVRILETGCGHCRSTGAPPEAVGSVRTFQPSSAIGEDARVFVVSPETAAACAIHGKVTDPRKLRRPPRIKLPRQLPVDDSMILKPAQGEAGRQLSPLTSSFSLPAAAILEDELRAQVIDRLGHSATLDRLGNGNGCRPIEESPGSAPFASCVVAGRRLSYRVLSPEVALSQRQAGLRVVIAEGFEPPCAISLANAGVLPLRFLDTGDYDRLQPGDELLLRSISAQLRQGEPILVAFGAKGEFRVACDLDERTREVLRLGGLLQFLKHHPPTTEPRSST